MVLACHAGMRISEIIGLKRNGVYTIQPLQPVNIQKDRIFISQGKGKKDRWVWRPKLINNNAISQFPLKVCRRAIQGYVNDISEKVLGKKISIHQLRHTFATEFLKKNPGDIRTLQILLGHSRLDTTSIYSHVSIDDALEKVEDVF